MREKNDDTIVFQGKIFDIVREPYVARNGDIEYFEFAQTKDTVRVYPITEDNKILLISEDRYGIKSESVDNILRVVAGGIEAEESPEDAAIRELKEEIGFTGSDPVIFHSSYPILKVRNRVFHVLVKAVEPCKSGAQPDNFENIRILPVEIDAIENMVWNGDFMEDIIAFGLLKVVRYLKN